MKFEEKCSNHIENIIAYVSIPAMQLREECFIIEYIWFFFLRD